MKKVLLIGAKGQVGQELQLTLPQLGEVISIGREELDLTNSKKISQLIREIHPDYLVNAAAYTAVDKAETEPDLAYSINAIAPKIMAESAEKIKAKFLHISTDYVFDGRKNTPYLESDLTNPLGVYGQSKLRGEEEIKTVNSQAIILRTAWVYGSYGKSNFVKTMLRLGKEREELKVVVDQVGSPTWSKDIATAITHLLINVDNPAGIYNFTNSGVASWFDLTKAIFEEAKISGIPLKIQRVIPITTAEYPTPAVRPAYSVLSGQKISQQLGYIPPYWRDSLKAMLNQLFNL
ncbi:MAG: dTDP-4-dehydrorhamnose reductase [Microcystis panniformis Mp_MB_F_20051200_S9]|uniref:dTDP-4-dehydrorhamnose reductase n=1 Tax=Microcystis panniformis Mp_MB_F_20051200_S9 TaxID=2486223 RepID=A0A552PUJ2_9CHRO|nr:MAG: dTDP-4-dehydrorhamnose reductase [Microcystis panniformis Mp_MB_F_20080800_S26D]TRV50376.1 MAG: dTDP-4-dehydrorhamnose reductase [Microcystis panniformis Mp_GB_SS_20050300_S99]TRV55146.1 MAG: dTDP-4-dehydrorhamnose reductase [Microcystis panniformis Mp_GB_SS_20050300_S99D]TRV60611.1 MAG: dTDP-4-dehydrorhamnose reductase [Microcystis panniformis Mp_MB_F_20051200_S9]TRV64443.1 MAG: dTDP-4-dehydrorhamnose reductase [Microcystis panniformis Mp_MB_F_20080800_S26]TRV67818.1 MAG: dTDP-4-dehyd